MKYYALILVLFSLGVFAANTRIFYEDTIFTKDVTIQGNSSIGTSTATSLNSFGPIGIGGSPDSSAAFDITTTSLVGKPYGAMNTAQMNAITVCIC